MGRNARIALDFALGSLKKIRPAVSSLWDNAKCYVVQTRAKKLVCNPIVSKLEEKTYQLVDFLVAKMTDIRDKQLPKEVEYLEKQLAEIKQRAQQAGTGTGSVDKDPCSDMSKKGKAAKTLKAIGGTSWKYLKVEAAPPMTVAALEGSVGKQIEDGASKLADAVINTLAGQIKSMDLAAERLKREKEAAIKAQEEKLKAEAKQKEEEKKAAAAAKAKVAAEAAKKAAEAAKQTAEAAKAKESQSKAAAAKTTPKQPEPKKEVKKPEAKKEEKKPEAKPAKK